MLTDFAKANNLMPLSIFSPFSQSAVHFWKLMHLAISSVYEIVYIVDKCDCVAKS